MHGDRNCPANQNGRISNRLVWCRRGPRRGGYLTDTLCTVRVCSTLYCTSCLACGTDDCRDPALYRLTVQSYCKDKEDTGRYCTARCCVNGFARTSTAAVYLPMGFFAFLAASRSARKQTQASSMVIFSLWAAS
jgi:hypothetical protein